MQENSGVVKFSTEKCNTVLYVMYIYFPFMDANCEENTRINVKCFLLCKKIYRNLNGRWNHGRKKNFNEVVQILAMSFYCKKGKFCKRDTINYHIKWYRDRKLYKAGECYSKEVGKRSEERNI